VIRREHKVSGGGPILSELVANQILGASLVAWFTAQATKLIIHLARDRKIDFRYLVSAGGMPSAHSTLVAALATAVGIQEGWSSPIFAVAVAFAIVVMFDAQGVRRAASAQARILNQMLDEFFQGHPISEERLKELLGHTPFQVLVGAAIGVLVAWFWMR
jgi:hypothetical protein